MEEANGKGTWDSITAMKVINRRDVRDKETDSFIRGPETFFRPILSVRVITIEEIRDTLMNAIFRVKGGSHRVRLLTAHLKTNAPGDINNVATEALTIWMNRDEIIELAVVNEAIRNKVPHVRPREIDREEAEVKLPVIEAEPCGKHRGPEVREGRGIYYRKGGGLVRKGARRVAHSLLTEATR